MKKNTLLSFVVAGAILCFGTIAPLIAQGFFSVPQILRENYRRANEPFSECFLAVRVVEGSYTNSCTDQGLDQVILQPYYWMMIPGSELRACVLKGEDGSIEGIKNIGVR